MKFSSDKLTPFFEKHACIAKHLNEVQSRKEIVITRRGKPAGALPSTAQLHHDHEQDRTMGELLSLLKPATPQPKLTMMQIAVVRKTEQLLAKTVERA